MFGLGIGFNDVAIFNVRGDGVPPEPPSGPALIYSESTNSMYYLFLYGF